MVLWAYRLSLVAAALAVCMASIGCGGGTRPTAVDGSPDGGSPPDNTPISVTDEQLIQELIADSKQVTKKYAVGKVLEVSGLVSNVFPDTAHYEPKIYLGGAKLNRPRYVDFNKGSKDDAYIHCRFRSGGERFLQIAYGQKIKVRGKSAMVFEGMGHMAPSLALEACELIDASPNTAAAVSPDELAKEFVANPAEAKKKYDGKVLVVTGKVAEVNGDGRSGVISFDLETEKAKIVGVRFDCKPDTQWHAQLTKIKKGDRVKVCGLCGITVGPSAGPPVTLGAPNLSAVLLE